MNSNNRRRTRSRNQRSRFTRQRGGTNRPNRRPLKSSFRKTSNRTNNNSKSNLKERRRIKVENLNKEFQNSELKTLFEPYGTLIRCGIRFNKMGESTGTADIEFSKHEECEEAINKLDNAEIDGVKLRVKYADFGPRTGRRVGSLSNRRRNLRAINRENRRNTTKSGRTTRKSAEKSGKSTLRTTRRRRAFRRVLGRKRK